MAQYNFKTTDKSITEYLDGQTNVSKTIKEAILIHKMGVLNPKTIEEKPIIQRKIVNEVRVRI